MKKLDDNPAQWLAAHGNGAGAQWVYDALAELDRRGAAIERVRELAQREFDRTGADFPLAIQAALDAEPPSGQ